VSTGTELGLTNFSATLPMIACSKPRRPGFP